MKVDDRTKGKAFSFSPVLVQNLSNIGQMDDALDEMQLNLQMSTTAGKSNHEVIPPRLDQEFWVFFEG